MTLGSVVRKDRASMLLAIIAAPAAWAEGLEASAQATNDYVFRGLSQTLGDAAVQMDAHYVMRSGWFGGAFASTVHLDDEIGPRFELNPYLGYVWDITPVVSGKIVAVRYLYRGGVRYIDYDYDELIASVDVAGRVALSVAWSPNLSRYSESAGLVENRTATAVELTAYQPLAHGLALSVGLGYQDLSDLFGRSYVFYSAGWTWSVGAFSWDMFRYGAGDAAHHLFGAEIARDGWSTALRWRF